MSKGYNPDPSTIKYVHTRYRIDKSEDMNTIIFVFLLVK